MLNSRLFCTKCWNNRSLSKPLRHSVLRGVAPARNASRIRIRGERTPPNPPRGSHTVMPRLTFATIGCVGGAFLGCSFWQDRALAADARGLPMWYEESSLIDKMKLEFRKYFRRDFSSADILYCMVGICSTVAIGWFVKPLTNVMARNFVSSLSSPNPVRAMILSGYSHGNLTHLALNLLGVFFIGSMVSGIVRKEELTFMIFASGAVSSYTGLAVNAVLRDFSRMSLGASGILYAFAGFVFSVYPQAGFSIFPVSLVYPHRLEGRQLLIGLLVFDMVGLLFLRQRSILDHAGHLGGLLFGVSYAHYGREIWYNQVDRWRKFRK